MLTTALVIWAIAAIAAGIVASNKNRSAAGWFIATLIFTPLLLIIVLVLAPLPASPGQAAAESAMSHQNARKCPFCAEYIKPEALICKHCGKDVQGVPDAPPPPEKCPACGTERSKNTYQCDCGYDYVTRKAPPSPTAPTGFGG